MSLGGYLRQLLDRLNRIAEQWYTPKELQALLFFVVLGVAVLMYRGGAVYEQIYPSQIDASIARESAERDSLFRYLSQLKIVEEEPIFYDPEIDTPVRGASTKKTETKLLQLEAEGSKISLNTGSREELMRLPSVGPATADAILEYRRQRGQFRMLEEIQNVPGIGPKKFEKMQPYIRLD